MCYQELDLFCTISSSTLDKASSHDAVMCKPAVKLPSVKKDSGPWQRL